MVCDHLSRRRLDFFFFLGDAAGRRKVGLKPCLPCAFWGGLWSLKPSAPEIVFFFFLRDAAGEPKVGLKPCLPCAFWGGLWSFKPSAPAIKICLPGAPPKKLRWAIFFAIYTPQIYVPTLFSRENISYSEFFGFFDNNETFQKVYRERKNGISRRAPQKTTMSHFFHNIHAPNSCSNTFLARKSLAQWVFGFFWWP